MRAAATERRQVGPLRGRFRFWFFTSPRFQPISASPAPFRAGLGAVAALPDFAPPGRALCSAALKRFPPAEEAKKTISQSREGDGHECERFDRRG